MGVSPIGYAVAALAVLVAGVASWIWFGRSAPERAAVHEAASGKPASQDVAAGDKARQPTLYCEFTNFADRTPLVGFYFLIESAKTPPVYALIFKREKDVSQADSGDETAPRPEWRFENAENPAVLHAPDDAITINLYDYDPDKRGVTWFEAGLRSIEYKNLGGKCRRSAT